MRKQKGFTLIELLIVVAIIGIIALIAIPNLINAMNRGRQKRCMADMRGLSTAVQAYEVDFAAVPKNVVGDTNAFIRYISPTFIKKVPTKDGWGQPYGVRSHATGMTFTLWSMAKGSEDIITGPPEHVAGGTASTFMQTTLFTDDIILVDERFIQWPEGMQIN